MSNGRQNGAEFVADLRHQQHERALGVQDEHLISPLQGDNRGEGTEGLPKFYSRVDDILHPGEDGISENGAVAEGPWAKFATALKPRNNAPLGQGGSNGVYHPFRLEFLHDQ